MFRHVRFAARRARLCYLMLIARAMLLVRGYFIFRATLISA